MANHFIECNNISFSYENGKEILKGVSFQIGQKEAVGIIGANGVG